MKTHYMKLTAFMAVMLSCVTAMAAVGQHPSLAKVLVKGVADSLSITNTSIAFGDKVLLHDMDISIAALDSTAVPELDYGMFNVSVDGEGYRFLPHGTHFNGNGATVRLKYDRTRIPSGYTEDDIRTYYFDQDRKCWVALPRVEVDKQSACVVSKTTHFTDMINGVIVAPESPETDAFTPTMMNDIKAADPTSKINIIMPPTANNRGSANLTYPFEMPPARNGMQPQIALSYNSDGGSGWAGEGWDISIPTISIDTRWGVPRYNDTIETETYLLNGQMLAMMNDNEMTVAHRQDSIHRQSDRQFFLRQGGDFSKIIRMGDSVSDYHWEITDRNGVVYTYGGNDNSVLKDTITDVHGNRRLVAAEWKLSRVQETHGDYINYYYSNVEEQVFPGLLAKANYLDSIEAGNVEQTFPHTIVVFANNSQPKTMRLNNARYGFLTSSNRLLDHVTIKYKFLQDRSYEILRTYALTYHKDTTFCKDVLKKITQLKGDGASNDPTDTISFQVFDYYDDVKGPLTYYLPYTIDEEKWGFNDTTAFSAFDGDAPLGHSSRPTALGATYSKTDAASLYAGVGFGFTSGKSLTAGVSTSFSQGRSEGKSALIDIDGDGLLDIVYKDSAGLRYFPQISTNDSIKFGSSRQINTEGHLDDFSLSKTTSISGGGKVYGGVGPLFAEGGMDIMSSKTTTTHYFADVNSDGLIDIVANGQVYFNHIEDGVPTFTLSSAVTPSPINNKGVIDTTCLADLNEPIDTLIKYSPMQDVVRVWEAPYDGIFRINSSVKYLIPSDTSNTDGVRVAIQIGENERWQQIIGKNDSTEYEFELDTLLFKGNCIYFRTQCGNDSASNGEFDRVKWNTRIIDYLHLNDTIIDPDGYNYYAFSTTDPIPSSSIGQLPINGSIAIQGTFNKPETSDSVTVNILYRYIEHFITPNQEDSCAYSDPPELIYTHTYPCGAINTNFTPQIPDTCNNGLLIFEMSSESNIAWDRVEWNPIVQQDTVSFKVSPAVTRFNKRVLKGDPYVAVGGSRYYSYWRDIQVDNNYTGYLLQTIKSENGLIAKDTVFINNGTSDYDQVNWVYINNGERIWIDYYADNDILVDSIRIAKIQIRYPNSYHPNLGDGNGDPMQDPHDGVPVDDVNANVYTMTQDSIIGTNLRGWGQFVYNAFNDRYDHSIELNTLVLPRDSAGCDPLNMSISLLTPKTEDSTYLVGAKPEIFIHGDTVGVARLRENNVVPIALFGHMVDEIDDPIGETLKGTTARGLTLVSKSNSTDRMVSAGIAMFSATLNQSNGSSTTQNAFMDMNGDGYPDIVTKKSIQYTNTVGGFAGGGTLYRENQSFASEEMEMTTLNKAKSVGLGGNYVHSFSTSRSGGTSEASRDNAQAAASISGNLNVNCDSVLYSYVDINGDGLPDMLSVRENQVTKARLNLGYHFTDEFMLLTSTPEIQSSVAKSFSASLGGSFNIDAASFSGGFGISTTTTRDSTSFFDINGDGLPDKVTRTNNRVDVQLNLGNRFQTVDWRGIGEISTNSSTTKSENVSFTINFYPFGGKLAITPGYNRSSGMSRPNYELRDIDGDGFLDVLESDNESDLRVHCSTIARTNKLKTVTNSLGGKFTIDYKRSIPTYGLPGGKWVMSSVEVDYGIDYNNYKIPNTKTVFEYRRGVRNRREREFYGFGEVKSKQFFNRQDNHDLFRQTIEEYDTTSLYSTGSLLSSRVEDASGRMLSKTSNEYYMYGLKNSYSGHNAGQYSFDSTFDRSNDHGAAYAPIKYSQNKQYERTDTGTVMSESWYQYYVSPGDHGLLRNYKYSNKGGLDSCGNGTIDYRTNISYYSKLNRLNHIFGLPATVIVYNDSDDVYHKITASYNDSNNPTQITNISTLLDYNVDTFGPGVVIHGDIDTLNGETNNTNGITDHGGQNNPYGPQRGADQELPTHQVASNNASTTYTYDCYGNLRSVTLPSNGYGQNLTYTCKFDSTMMNMYPVEITDSYGYKSFSDSIDYHYGIARKRHDIHSMNYYTYTDNLGRVTGYNSPIESSLMPGGNLANPLLKTVELEYEPKAVVFNGKISRPAYSVTKHLNNWKNLNNNVEINQIKTITFVDGFGRPIQVQKESVIQNAAGDGTEHVLVVSGQQVFDEFGRMVQNYYPTTIQYTEEIAFCDSVDIVNPTVKYFDELDRLDSIALPDGTLQSFKYGIDGHSMVSKFYDENGHLSETYTDGSGRTVKSVQYKDVDNSQPLTTSFEYDGIGRLVKVTDTEGNETLSEYDYGDRRISVTHPASGKTTFSYANNGNLLTKKTANMQGTDKEIRYKYHFGQLDSIFYPDHPENNVVYHYGNSNDEPRYKGRVKLRIDGTGAIEYDYGKLGEVTKERRTVIVPNHEVSTFETVWVYDSHNRLDEMTYPDGTTVEYFYDDAGQLDSIRGKQTNGNYYHYVNKIRYDKFGDRVYMEYGNGAITTYQYTPEMRRLNNLNIDGLYGNGSIRTSFTYDSVGNITSVARSMNIGASPAMLNGTIIHTYEYDPLYRLIKGEGHFGDNQANYSLDMSYDDMYRITSKKQDLSQSNIQFEGTLFSGYDLDYAYNTTPGKRFQMASVSDVNYRTEEEPTEDEAVVENHCYKYDNNGNIICVNTSRTMPDVGFQSGNVKKMREERFRWDEENRLLAISQNGYMSHYWYDADGERVVKEHGASQAVFVNSEQNAALTQTEKYAVYPSPFFTYTNGGIYTRHIYIGSERIASQVSNSLNYSPSALDVAGHSDDIRIRVDYERKREELRAQIDSAYSEFDLVYQGIDHDNNDYDFLNDDYWNNTFGLMMNGEDHISSTPRDNQRDLVYFYHRDHLGSSTAVSNDDGKLSQQIEYLPYGEVFLEKQMTSSDYHSPYKFNGKELDEETGLYYYGARYMNPRLSIWYGTDKRSEELPDISAYSFSHNNPINRIDNDGKWDITVSASSNRGAHPYAIFAVYDRHGNLVYKTVVKAQGKFRQRNRTNADTPQGKYQILEWRKTGNERYPKLSYGPNDLLALEYLGGEGKKRQGMHVHGGRRQEPDLMSTYGCMRMADKDIAELKIITDQLELNDSNEKRGLLTLTDDLKTPIEYKDKDLIKFNINDQIHELPEIVVIGKAKKSSENEQLQE